MTVSSLPNSHMPKLRSFVYLVLSFSLLTSFVLPASVVAQEEPESHDQPNIILILADDLGFGETEPYGSDFVKTPNLTKLAEDGLKFNNYYTNPLCGQTRSALMTGMFSQRFGFRLNCNVGTYISRGLPREATTYGELLQQLGYETHHIGKWHLGYDIDVHFPMDNGFDTFYGPYDWGAEGQRIDPVLYDNRNQVSENGNVTNLYGDKAVSIIQQYENSDTPFFINYWSHAPHVPNFPESDWLDGYSNPNHSYTKYAASVTGLDLQIKKIVDELEHTGQLENTVLMFASDNGLPSQFLAFSDNAGLRGSKTKSLQGGIRAPLIISWPGTVQASTETDIITHVTDIAPTLIELAGGNMAETDGRSILPIMRGEELEDRDIYIENKTLNKMWGAYLQGDWKYVTAKGSEFLYNITDDPGEQQDLKQQQSEIFNTLRANYWAQRLNLAEVAPGFNTGESTAQLAETSTVEQITVTSADQIAVLNDSPYLNVSSWEFSFDAWIKIDAAGAGTARSIMNNTGDLRLEITAQEELLFSWKQYKPNGRKQGKIIRSGVFLEPNTWYHIAVSMDATPAHAKTGKVSLYVDGVEVGSKTRKYDVQTAQSFTLGNTPALARPLQGTIMQPRFYDTALLPAEVAQMAAWHPTEGQMQSGGVFVADTELSVELEEVLASAPDYGSYRLVFVDADGNAVKNYMLSIAENHFVGEPDENGIIYLPFEAVEDIEDITVSLSLGDETITKVISAAEIATAENGIVVDQMLFGDSTYSSSQALAVMGVAGVTALVLIVIMLTRKRTENRPQTLD